MNKKQNEPFVISVCMGSSCYSRGNREAIEQIQTFIEDNNLADEIELRGNLCEDICECGPNVRVDGKLCCHAPDTLTDCLEKLKVMAAMKAVNA